MQNSPNLFPWTKKLDSLTLSTFSANWNFWVNYTLNTKILICLQHTKTNWHSWKIWENSLHILQKEKREMLSKYHHNYFANHTLHNLQRSHVLQVMCTCPSGVWLWPESSARWRSQTPPHWGASGWSCCSDTGSRWCDSLPQCHWWTWASASATPASESTHKQKNINNNKSMSPSRPQYHDSRYSWNDTHLHQDHVELRYVNPFLL